MWRCTEGSCSLISVVSACHSDHLAPRSGQRHRQAVGCAAAPAKTCRCKGIKPTPAEQVHLRHPSELGNASACGFNKYCDKSVYTSHPNISFSGNAVFLSDHSTFPLGKASECYFRHRNVVQKYRRKKHLGKYQGVLLNRVLLFHCLYRTPH